MKSLFLNLWRKREEKRAAARRKQRRQPARRRSWNGRGEALEARQLLTVTYSGGALLTNVEAQAVYLGSDWAANASLQSQAKSTDQFLSTLTGGSYMDMLNNAGYGVGRGSASAGAVDNINLNKNVALTDSQIRSDLEAMISNGQSGLQAPDANRLYMIYVEPGVTVQMGTSTSRTGFLGYHGAFGYNGADIHYAVMPFPGTPNPSPGSQGFATNFDELTSVSSHELAEAVTDPNVNYKTMGWYDFQLNGEIADLTRQTSTISDASGTQYEVQDVINKNDQVISPTSSQPSPSPSPTPPPTPGLSAPTLTASVVSSTVAQLSWTAASGTQGYRVFQEVGGQSVLLGTVSANATAVQVTGLTPGATESFVVEAFNSSSVADSAVASVTMPTPTVQRVTAPQVSAHATSPTSVVLSWGAESQATGYNIYWSNGYQILYLGTVNGSTSSVTVTGLSPGSSSFFVVEAFNNVSVADSGWVYVATPSYYTAGGYSGFAQYGQQQGGNAWWGGSTTPSVFANPSHSRWGREPF